MAVLRLTKRAVDSLAPRSKIYIAYDLDLKGFGVRVLPSRVKSWVVEYRPSGGRNVAKRRMTLGAVGTLTPTEARKAAREILAAVRLGSDPVGERQARRDAVDISVLAASFMTEHVQPKRKPATIALYLHLLDHYVVPEVGRRKAAELTRTEVAKLHHALRDRPYLANRLLAVVGSMFTWASKRGLVPELVNPAHRIEKFPEKRRERFLNTEELRRLGEALREAETTGIPWEIDANKKTAKHAPQEQNRRTFVSPYAIAAIRLLIFTGARLREILELRWDWADLERGLLLLPDSKTGKKAIVLNAPAVAVLADLPRMGPYVIAANDPNKYRADLNRPWRSIRKRARLDTVRIHDLRHTHASFGAAGGLGLPIIGKLLGHTQARTTERYAHLDADPLRRASESIASRIAAAMGGETAGKVIALTGRHPRGS